MMRVKKFPTLLIYMKIQIFQFLIQIFCLIFQFVHIQIQSLYLFINFAICC